VCQLEFDSMYVHINIKYSNRIFDNILCVHTYMYTVNNKYEWMSTWTIGSIYEAFLYSNCRVLEKSVNPPDSVVFWDILPKETNYDT